MMRKEISLWIMWGLIIFGLSMTALCLIMAKPAHATTWFNPVPNTLVNGTIGLSAQVNADYNSIIADGNAANTNLLAQIAALGPGGLPAGAVVAFNLTCPTGFALADGVQGRPDARGLYIRGLDNQAGRDPNRVLASYQADQIQNHFHNVIINASLYLTPIITNSGSGSPAAPVVVGAGSGTNIMANPSGGVETRPASIVLNYCINNTIGVGASPFSPPPRVLSNLVVPDANVMMANFNRIISDGNAAFNVLQAAITAASGLAAMPAGAVVPFNLTICPSGWVVADGTGGTVDMRGRFARITTGSPAVGTVQADQFIDHTHTITGPFVVSSSGTQAVCCATAGVNPVISNVIYMSVLGAIGANVGTETRPKNVALLYCQKS
jgi:hypothetical protein